MARTEFDVIVIGGGPAGYAAALRAARLGFATLCIDDRGSAGGTCLHVGCIPSKALLASTERYDRARDELADHGVSVGSLDFDLDAMMARKQDVVDRLTSGVDGLLEKRGVARLGGRAALQGRGEVRVATDDEEETRTVAAPHVLLATGSAPATLPGVAVDGSRIVSSDEAIALSRVPEHLAVVGGGYIGLELGSVWRRLGADVTVVEVEDQLLPGMDVDLAEALEERLREQGMAIRRRCAVRAAEAGEEGVRLSLRPTGSAGQDQEPSQQQSQEAERRESRESDGDTLACSHVLVAVGREPVTAGLGLEAAGVECDDAGFVRVDGRFRTTAAGVYAVGDLVGEPMLAHKAQLEAIACVDAIAGRGAGYVDYDAVPAVVYTWPEVATLGRTEAALREAGTPHRVGRASFTTDSRALCTGEAVGFVKLLAEVGSDRLLGAHVIGPHAGTLVHELVLGSALRASVEELGRAPHAHPTLNEAIREAALSIHDRAIHQ